MKIAVVVLAAVGLSLAAAATVDAAPPPVAKYDCVIGSSSILFGTIAIQSGGTYTHSGSKGTFTTGAKRTFFADKKTSGYTIAFKGGDLNGIKGRWYYASAGGGKKTVEIALRNPKDNFESIYCDKV